MLKLLGYGFVIFIAVVLVYADMGWDLFLFDWVKYLPFKDKLGHFLLIGTLTFFVNILLDFRRVNIGKRELLLGSVLVFLFFTLEEMSQAFLANRNCEFLDFLCNTFGILIFERLALKLKNQKIMVLNDFM